MVFMNQDIERSLTEEDKTDFKVTMDDFDIIKVLGRGTYGKVMLVEKQDTKEQYAMKSLRKKYIIDENQIEHNFVTKISLRLCGMNVSSVQCAQIRNRRNRLENFRTVLGYHVVDRIERKH